MKLPLLLALLPVSLLTLTGCLGMPEKVTPVEPFALDRYLGKWYEIARLDHSFERGMNNVTAEYSKLEGGGVKVLNRGYLASKEKWKQSEGKALFVGEQNVGYLKVSFFGPFYGSYVVFELDHENYQYAFVSGPDNDYLWLLARQPNPPAAVVELFTRRAAELGFDTGKLIWVAHD